MLKFNEESHNNRRMSWHITTNMCITFIVGVVLAIAYSSFSYSIPQSEHMKLIRMTFSIRVAFNSFIRCSGWLCFSRSVSFVAVIELFIECDQVQRLVNGCCPIFIAIPGNSQNVYIFTDFFIRILSKKRDYCPVDCPTYVKYDPFEEKKYIFACN